jgi:hypothetical protein
MSSLWQKLAFRNEMRLAALSLQETLTSLLTPIVWQKIHHIELTIMQKLHNTNDHIFPSKANN